jgi:hypothetical protein
LAISSPILGDWEKLLTGPARDEQMQSDEGDAASAVATELSLQAWWGERRWLKRPE